MARIRDDFEGAVHVDGHVLVAGDEAPEGVRVGSHLTGEEPKPAPEGTPVEDGGEEFDPLAEEPEPAPSKPRGRPRKTQQ